MNDILSLETHDIDKQYYMNTICDIFQTSFVDCLMEWTHTELEATEGKDVSIHTI